VARITPNGADLLATALADRTDRFPPVVVNLSAPLREALNDHLLLAFSSAPGPACRQLDPHNAVDTPAARAAGHR
jgi:hypothetical protein